MYDTSICRQRVCREQHTGGSKGACERTMTNCMPCEPDRERLQRPALTQSPPCYLEHHGPSPLAPALQQSFWHACPTELRWSPRSAVLPAHNPQLGAAATLLYAYASLHPAVHSRGPLICLLGTTKWWQKRQCMCAGAVIDVRPNETMPAYRHAANRRGATANSAAANVHIG